MSATSRFTGPTLRPRIVAGVVIGLAAAPLALSLGDALAQGGADVTLPPPQTEGGMPLMQALKARRTSRSFAPEELTPQTLSNLLWAAFGVNRPDGHRTAPSARNWQEIDIYVATSRGSVGLRREGARAAPRGVRGRAAAHRHAGSLACRAGDAGLRGRHAPHDGRRRSDADRVCGGGHRFHRAERLPLLRVRGPDLRGVRGDRSRAAGAGC